jgi:putative ABC transport system ATP-binding protein
VIELEDIEVRSDGRLLARAPRWTVPTAEAALLIGASGSGKTTLLNVIAGLVRPSAGRVRIAGEDIGAMNEGQRDLFRGRTIGIVFQTLRLVRALNVRENLNLALRLAGQKPDAARVDETLARLGIGSLAGVNPRRLSIGEMQRAAIARAVVARPKLILADEPTSALDDENAAAALTLLTDEARACGATLIIATHDGRIKDAIPGRLELERPA